MLASVCEGRTNTDNLNWGIGGSKPTKIEYYTNKFSQCSSIALKSFEVIWSNVIALQFV